MIDNDNVLLAHALTYAKQGWRIHPLHGAADGKCSCGKGDCSKKGKHPRIKDWPKAATTEESLIRQWWAAWPDANIGVATGLGSGVFVIDVDGPTGLSTLEKWKREHDWQAGTLTAITGRGSHLYFRQSDRKVPTSAGKLGKGIDVRGDGGYVVAPPSTHASGHRYAWKDAERSVAAAPSWLTEAVAGGSIASRGPSVPVDDAIPEGLRNHTLFKAGCYLRGLGHSAEDIEPILRQMNACRCDPPLDPEEVKRITQSVAKYKPGKNKANYAASPRSPLWWFPFNVNDWLSDENVSCMEDYQVGWYICLLAQCWKRGGTLPNDPQRLRKLARACNADQFATESAPVMRAFALSEDETEIIHPGFRALWSEKLEDVVKKSDAGSTKNEPGKPDENSRRGGGRKSGKAAAEIETEAA
ncbi:MAG: bifunctional DNA primase/polymerase [Candidatus Solibacter sp.]|jgi:uncharacterized protein YdaU (DUF1376 family)